MVESKWWNSTVAQTFKDQVTKLNACGPQLRAIEYEFVNQMRLLIQSNDDFVGMDIDEWQPSAKQINYASALYRQYCVDRLDR